MPSPENSGKHKQISRIVNMFAHVVGDSSKTNVPKVPRLLLELGCRSMSYFTPDTVRSYLMDHFAPDPPAFKSSHILQRSQ